MAAYEFPNMEPSQAEAMPIRNLRDGTWRAWPPALQNVSGVKLKTQAFAGSSETDAARVLRIVTALRSVWLRLRSDSTGQKRRLWHSRLFLDGVLS